MQGTVRHGGSKRRRSQPHHPTAPESGDADAGGGQSGLAPGLYVVATPIGNARDITLRALDVLAGVDVIACEDTRVTARLLTMHGLSTPLFRYDDHNAPAAGGVLLERLAAGDRVALVSDAGTPLISDPGYRLVRAASDGGVPVYAIPGPSAVTAALSIAGLPTDRFLFAGFPPARPAARRRFLEDLAGIPATLVLMEAPHRCAATLADLAQVLGPREAAVGRELTKRFEEMRRGPLDVLARAAADMDRIRGEITIVITSAPAARAETDATETAADLDRRLVAAMAHGSVKDAVDALTGETGLPRRQVYARALALSRRGS
ncbi:MAG: 16S rRNA (cytidine(1402)-2'-O)-methyltransferase [Rhodospirillales bacterium]|nr:MAG: 16S rRNA (cytidine(1402)-2'-O)-methyltransferase [Rhodospirillales bacterium]